MNTIELDCSRARAALSSRLDGEPHDALPLERHLARCGDCLDHDRALRELAPAWRELREPVPAPDLWSSIERAAHVPFRRPRILPRIAAGLVGFLGLGGAAFVLERRSEPAGLADSADSAIRGASFLEPLAGARGASHEFLAALPDVQLLRRMPAEGDSR